MNLPASDTYIADSPGNFDVDDDTTYNYSTSVTVYDSLGDSHIMTYYFCKEDPTVTANQWNMFASVDGIAIDIDNNGSTTTGAVQGGDVSGGLTGRTQMDPYTGTGGVMGAILTFDSSGDFTGQTPTLANGGIETVPFEALILSNGAEPTQAVLIDFNLDASGPNASEPTQYASSFEVTSLEQDGLAVGRLTGIDIGNDGLVLATYSNGTSEPLSRIALVNFSSEQGLTQNGNSSWKESIASGEGLAGEASSGTYGSIYSSALEQSNVNLTSELIDLISAQRNFQANSRAIEVDNQLNQTILQIR